MDAIVVNGVTKTYRTGVGRARMREMIPPPIDTALRSAFPKWWSRNTFNALEDVTFSVARGEALGLLGHNGAGKTTMLRVIGGVTEATSGRVSLAGRTGALIDAIVGFHPELTGRENAYLLGAVYGFSRRSMASRVDRIFEFAELSEEFLETPVKRYSSGMVSRLGFSILANLDLEMLLIDEVLAVGDASFQTKCIGWLQEFRQAGGTLIFVSHNLGLIRSMTEQVVWLDHGRIVGQGPTAELLGRYARSIEQREAGPAEHQIRQTRRMMRSRGHHRWGAGGARVGRVQVEQPSDHPDGLELSIAYETSEMSDAVFCVGFVDTGDREIGAAASPPLSLNGGKGNINCTIQPLPLQPGIYFPVIAILSVDGRVRDRWRLERAVEVGADSEPPMGGDFGPVKINAEWARAEEHETSS